MGRTTISARIVNHQVRGLWLGHARPSDDAGDGSTGYRPALLWLPAAILTCAAIWAGIFALAF